VAERELERVTKAYERTQKAEAELRDARQNYARRCGPRDVNPIDLMPAAHAELLSLCGAGTGLVWRTKDGGPKSLRHISRAFSEVVEGAKLHRVGQGHGRRRPGDERK
jgi:hypothetical protein